MDHILNQCFSCLKYSSGMIFGVPSCVVYVNGKMYTKTLRPEIVESLRNTIGLFINFSSEKLEKFSFLLFSFSDCSSVFHFSRKLSSFSLKCDSYSLGKCHWDTSRLPLLQLKENFRPKRFHLL